MRSRSIAVLVAVVALLATGCARVSDAPSDPRAELRVSAGFGAEQLATARIDAGVSVMDAVRANTTVETAFGGGFVNAMHGRRATLDPKRDWFYYVNGLAPGRGAGEQTVRSGDRIWWDYHRWGDGASAPAVVGSWPEPFVHGYPETPGSVQADAPLDTVLRDAGAPVTTGESRWRVIVGAHVDLVQRDSAWARASADPWASGLPVAVADGTVAQLQPDGQTIRVVDGGRALAALVPAGTTPDDGGAVFVVAGLDAAAARAAADRIAREPAVLAGRYAVVFDGDGNPIASAGRPAP